MSKKKMTVRQKQALWMHPRVRKKRGRKKRGLSEKKRSKLRTKFFSQFSQEKILKDQVIGGKITDAVRRQISLPKWLCNEINDIGLDNWLSEQRARMEREEKERAAGKSKSEEGRHLARKFVSEENSGHTGEKEVSGSGERCLHGLLKNQCSRCKNGRVELQGRSSVNFSSDGIDQVAALAILDISKQEFQEHAKILARSQAALTNFCEAIWSHIDSSGRAVGLDRGREYRFPVDILELREIGLAALVFRQGGLRPPSVEIRWEGLNGACIDGSLDENGLLSLRADFQEWSTPPVHEVLRVVAISFYHDLVMHDSETESIRKVSRSEGRLGRASKKDANNRRRLPRKKSQSSQPTRGRSNRRESNTSQVVGFRRRLPVGRFPSPEKIFEAATYGIDLKGPDFPRTRYTYVSPHVRGQGEISDSIAYEGVRAIRLIETLFDSVSLFPKY